MTEAEKETCCKFIGEILNCMAFGDNRQAVKLIKELSGYADCMGEDIDDWSESVEARLTNLEKRVSMINAFYVAKEVEDNERRKAREKPLHACRRHRKRAFCRQDNGV